MGEQMARIEINGNIGSLLNFYKEETRLFGRCPHCQEPFRLSEVKLTYGKEPPKDLLTRMKSERDRLKEKLEQLEEDIEDTQREHDNELGALDDRWKDKVSTAVERQLLKTVRQIRKDAIA